MYFLSVIILAGCIIGILISIILFFIIGSTENEISFLSLIAIIICIITISSIFQFSTYTLENNIKNNHTYVVKGKIGFGGFNGDNLQIDSKNYNVNFKYSIESFALSDFVKDDKVEVVIADSVFDNYIIKVNKIEKNINPEIDCDYLGDYKAYFIKHPNKYINTDKKISDFFNIPYDKYKELLIKYGATLSKNGEYYFFKSKEDAQKFIDSEELSSYLNKN